MKNLLVPTDFSDNSRSAARFAAQLAGRLSDSRIILYNQFESFEAGTDSSPVHSELEDRKAVRLVALNNIKNDMLGLVPGLNIECMAEDGTSLVDSIQRMVAKEMIDLMVMGITGATRLEQILIGSNTLRLIRNATCPVLVIPPDAGFKKISKVALAVDLEKRTSSLPMLRLKAMLDMFPASLHIVTVKEAAEETLSEKELFEKKELENALKNYNPAFHEVVQSNFLDGINDFVVENKVDLLLTVPRRISFLSDLFRNTHTEKLGYYSQVPFIAVHE